MIDLIKNFAKHEKAISRSLTERIDDYDRSDCKRSYKERVDRLKCSWDMVPPNGTGNNLIGLTYLLVKEHTLVTRSIFTANFRADPLWSLKAIGNTPRENAMNMQDLLIANNEQMRFRPNVLIPGIDLVCKDGAAVIFTEYCEYSEMGWQTIADPMFGSQRVYGPTKRTKNAKSTVIDFINYFQNPRIVNPDYSDIRGHVEPLRLSTLVARYKQHPELYIKENIEKVIKNVKKEHFKKDEYYTDQQGKESARDFGGVNVFVRRGQVQLNLEGNEEDNTYYYFEMVGETIIRFQDNPYDRNMNQYDIWLCESRREYCWGNTPAEYSVQNEDALNLLNGLGFENAIEAMKKYTFFNSNAISPGLFRNVAHNAQIPVDVGKDIALNNVLYQFQPQDTALPAIDHAYRRIMENNQRVTTTPDLNRAPSSGGPTNKTAFAADTMKQIGSNLDADILEKFSHCLSKTGEKHSIILSQFLGNFGPILITPEQAESIRTVQKEQILGNWSVYMDTALQKTNQGEIMRYQNIVTWLQNLVMSGLPLPVNFEPMVKQVIKMGEFAHVDEIIPSQQQPQAQIQQQPPQDLEAAA